MLIYNYGLGRGEYPKLSTPLGLFPSGFPEGNNPRGVDNFGYFPEGNNPRGGYFYF
jgi:hypothetical protein